MNAKPLAIGGTLLGVSLVLGGSGWMLKRSEPQPVRVVLSAVAAKAMPPMSDTDDTLSAVSRFFPASCQTRELRSRVFWCMQGSEHGKTTYEEALGCVRSVLSEVDRLQSALVLSSAAVSQCGRSFEDAILRDVVATGVYVDETLKWLQRNEKIARRRLRFGGAGISLGDEDAVPRVPPEVRSYCEQDAAPEGILCIYDGLCADALFECGHPGRSCRARDVAERLGLWCDPTPHRHRGAFGEDGVLRNRETGRVIPPVRPYQ